MPKITRTKMTEEELEDLVWALEEMLQSGVGKWWVQEELDISAHKLDRMMVELAHEKPELYKKVKEYWAARQKHASGNNHTEEDYKKTKKVLEWCMAHDRGLAVAAEKLGLAESSNVSKRIDIYGYKDRDPDFYKAIKAYLAKRKASGKGCLKYS